MYFPKDIFKNILNYCDDRLEKKQHNLLKIVLDDLIDRVECEWQAYLCYYGEEVSFAKFMEKDWPEYGDITISWWNCGDSGLIPLIN